MCACFYSMWINIYIIPVNIKRMRVIIYMIITHIYEMCAVIKQMFETIC